MKIQAFKRVNGEVVIPINSKPFGEFDYWLTFTEDGHAIMHKAEREFSEADLTAKGAVKVVVEV